MVLVYCEFQPSQHRNKRPATLVFLDDPTDKFPMAVCSVCAVYIQKHQPAAVIRDRSEFEKEKADKRKAARAAATKPAAAEPAPAAPAPVEPEPATTEPATNGEPPAS